MPKKVGTKSDLAKLNEAERRNYDAYAREKSRRGEKKPTSVWMFPFIWKPIAPRLSLILEGSECETMCHGYVVLQKAHETQIQKVKYLKNYAESRGDWNWRRIDDHYEMMSPQIYLWDVTGQNVLQIFDVWRAAAPVAPGEDSQHVIQVDRSEAIISKLADTQFNVSDCLRGRIPAGTSLPAR